MMAENYLMNVVELIAERSNDWRNDTAEHFYYDITRIRRKYHHNYTCDIPSIDIAIN